MTHELFCGLNYVYALMQSASCTFELSYPLVFLVIDSSSLS